MEISCIHPWNVVIWLYLSEVKVANMVFIEH